MRRAETKEQSEFKNNLNTIFLKTASTFAERINAIAPAEKVMQNAFGRTVKVSTTASLSYLHGLAVSGVRVAACFDAKEVSENLGTLAAMARNSVPATIVFTEGAISNLPELAQTGAIVFQAQNMQTFADRILNAQVVAEKTLLPVVVLAEFGEAGGEVLVPTKNELAQFYGDPDNFSGVKNEAQGIIFGNKRKRVPSWMNPNLPMAIGVKKQRKAAAFEVAAKEVYSTEHIQNSIDETATEFEKLTGRKLFSIFAFGSPKPAQAIISTARISKVDSESDEVKHGKITVYHLEQLNPLPTFEDGTWKRTERLTIVERFSATQNGWLFKEIAARPEFQKLKISHGFFVETLNDESWKAILKNCVNADKGLPEFWVDVPFLLNDSNFPKHQILTQQLARKYPELVNKSLPREKGRAENLAVNNPPASIKKYTEKGPAFTRVSRFFDDTACFYDSPADEMIADPFQSLAAMPVSTASFLPINRGWAPEFHPQKCQDIEAILKACPHGAMPAALLLIDDVLKAGIQAARKRGMAIGALVPMLKIWAKKASEIAQKDAKKIVVMNDFLPEAFAQTLIQAKAEGEKKATLEQEFAWTMESIAQIPVAFTDEYFFAAEKAKPATGQIFTLAVNPSACTGCGTCAELCTDASVQMNTDIQQIEKLNKERFTLFEGLPSTSDATVKGLLEDKNFDSFAALMLNSDLYSSFVGGTKGDDFSAEKSIIRMISVLAKNTLSTNSSELQKVLSKQMAALNAAVKKILGDSLPVTHLDSLMEVLHEHHEEKLSMDLIMKEWGQQDAFKVVQRDELQNKLDLINGLKEWKWALKEGFTGVGRADYSVVLDDSLANFATYPWNHFTVPVLLAERNKTAETALGVFEGQLRHALDQIKLLRRTDLEAVGKYDATVHDFQIAGLSWNELTDEEKKMVPPVLVLATHKIFTQFSTSALSEMLESGYPIKLFVLDNLNPNPENAAIDFSTNANVFWPLMGNSSTTISKVSLADANGMFAEMQSALETLNGAVVSILCPNTFAHNINPQRWRQLSDLAVNTRGYTPFSFNPATAGKSFGMKFNTQAVPQEKEQWLEVELKHIVEEEEQTLKYKPTWADWAFLLTSWKACFNKLENAANTVSMADFLLLDAEKRAKAIPVILRVNEENLLVRYAANEQVIKSTEAVQRSYNLFREIAGLHTAFPEKLKAEVEAELSKSYKTEEAKFKAELAKEKAAWEANHTAEIKEQIRTRLMQLAQEA